MKIVVTADTSPAPSGDEVAAILAALTALAAAPEQPASPRPSSWRLAARDYESTEFSR